MRPQPLQRLDAETADVTQVIDAAERAIALAVLDDRARLARADATHRLQGGLVCRIEVDGCWRRHRRQQGDHEGERQQTRQHKLTKAVHGRLQTDGGTGVTGPSSLSRLTCWRIGHLTEAATLLRRMTYAKQPATNPPRGY
jgi:hypothetical protein